VGFGGVPARTLRLTQPAECLGEAEEGFGLCPVATRVPREAEGALVVGSGSTYQAVTTDVRHAVHANVVVRLSVVGGAGLFTLRAARVDDLTLQCAN
jgi:hypothetical protein